MRFLFVLFTFFTLSLRADNLKESLYLQLQQSLAADDFVAAKSAFVELCKDSKQNIKNSEAHSACQEDPKTIKQIRKHFKYISEEYIEKNKNQKDSELVVAKCPMANARWLQKKGDLKNPYYGSKMLDCGEFESVK